VLGGNIFSDVQTTVIVGDSTFSNSIASKGGTIYSAGSTSLSQCTLCSINAATGFDGAAYAAQTGDLWIGNSTLCNNTALNGGALATMANSNLHILNSSIINNTATAAAGGIYQSSNNNMSLDKPSVIGYNTATCCHAKGYHITTNSNSKCTPTSTMTCADIDSGGDKQCCKANQYSDGVACHTCSDALDCSKLGITTATLLLKPHYWRADLNTAEAKECLNSAACIGGIAKTSPDDYCATGYKGPCKYKHICKLTSLNGLRMFTTAPALLLSLMVDTAVFAA
jgi:hypothetical protein